MADGRITENARWDFEMTQRAHLSRSNPKQNNRHYSPSMTTFTGHNGWREAGRTRPER